MTASHKTAAAWPPLTFALWVACLLQLRCEPAAPPPIDAGAPAVLDMNAPQLLDHARGAGLRAVQLDGSVHGMRPELVF